MTGCNTDSLPEEQARGMTIDLGYADCVLPDGRRVGIVDVPGHERFIHNMVAGAAGIDVVLLVVAADDGVMPQTIEHFHIVRLLGVNAGMVALTKIDIATPERVAEVEQQVRELVAGSFLDGSPIVPVSATTAQGFDRFYEVFTALVSRTAERSAGGPFRMHVESSFVLKGRGTVVTGIPRSGSVHAGDMLEMLPAGRRVKVKSVQVYGEPAEAGSAGECVALNVSDVSHTEAVRGMVLAEPGRFKPSRFINTRFKFLAGLKRGLRPRTAVRMHVGTSDMPGHLVLPSLEPLAPGEECLVQVQLRDPVVAAPGDFFVVRLLSPVVTLGGGRVVSQADQKMRRSRGAWEENTTARETAFRTPETAVEYVLRNAGRKPMAVHDISVEVVQSEAAIREILAALVQRGLAAELRGGRFAHADALKAVRAAVLEALGALHDATPLSLGFGRTQMLRALTDDHALIEKVVESLKAEGVVLESGAGLCVAARAPKLSAPQAVLAKRVTEAYRKAGFAAPRRDELPPIAGAPAGVVEPIVDFLLQSGELVELSDKVLLHAENVSRARDLLTERLKKIGDIDAGGFRDMIGASRKYAIPLMEYFDKIGLTRRVGDKRVLK